MNRHEARLKAEGYLEDLQTARGEVADMRRRLNNMVATLRNLQPNLERIFGKLAPEPALGNSINFRCEALQIRLAYLPADGSLILSDLQQQVEQTTIKFDSHGRPDSEAPRKLKQFMKLLAYARSDLSNISLDVADGFSLHDPNTESTGQLPIVPVVEEVGEIGEQPQPASTPALT